MFKVSVEDKVIKFLKKLNNKEITQRFDKIVDETFKINPFPKDKKHILDINSQGNYLCELSIDKFRFYYEIITGVVIINEIEYLGKVEILEGHSNHKSGNSKNYPNQQKTIKSLKKKFNDK